MVTPSDIMPPPARWCPVCHERTCWASCREVDMLHSCGERIMRGRCLSCGLAGNLAVPEARPEPARRPMPHRLIPCPIMVAQPVQPVLYGSMRTLVPVLLGVADDPSMVPGQW